MFKWEFHCEGSLAERLSKLYYFSALNPAGKICTFHFLNVCHLREIAEYPELQKNCVSYTYTHKNTLKHTESIDQQTFSVIHFLWNHTLQYQWVTAVWPKVKFHSSQTIHFYCVTYKKQDYTKQEFVEK